ncbi:imelysin family protein [Octadecabacter sp. 1_MG-2023]|uniref:imelysin family protein n=1 Tax=unclassified Octadecabacter TaxID=196158 RepID=UPI001C082DBA|nr:MULTISPECIES: imelysin family protein [unclassified Octadecabacter]MBU2993576.1 imelysin family protein [Octadecabacter sp. B2R22]MDO6735580.1 imelysin family protein [Octadecabacter sp. 1_MG-2023]
MKFAFPVLLATTLLTPFAVFADPRVDAVLDQHVLPRFHALTDATAALANAEDCDVVAEWDAATEAWIAVSHLRFGPTEVDNRAFSLAFWPDPRGSTPSALTTLLSDDAPAIADVSIAGRGFYALEYLLFDDAFSDVDGRCDLIAGLAKDANATAQAIEADWIDHYADLLRTTGNDTYRDDTEALQQLYGAITGGLDFAVTKRLGVPMGTFERPRPRLAEMRRSGRSLDNVAVVLESLEEMTLLLAGGDSDGVIADQFAAARLALDNVGEIEGGADFSIVADTSGRFKVEVLQNRISEIRTYLSEELGPQIGVIEGFNADDGD